VTEGNEAAALQAAIQEQVNASDEVWVAGGRSKSALSKDAPLSLTDLRGVLAYDPQEYTFTALAGTPVADIAALLSEHGQYLPFDPPFVTRGATLGGTVASGLSGPGRLRYGGVRDFILGVTFVDGTGEVVQGGGKVVKNAAGFDFPKLMVGSLGRFGVMVELTFKVFPAPQARATLELSFDDQPSAIDTMHRLAGASFELESLDYLPPATLQMRVGGQAQSLEARLKRLQQFVAQSGTVHMAKDDSALWDNAREFTWVPDGYRLLKVALSPSKVAQFEAALETLELSIIRRYSVAGNVCYLALPQGADLQVLGTLLSKQQLAALALLGDFDRPYLGRPPERVFTGRIASVLDPQSKFAREGASRAA
jgi:glycolate oxidase FAD binding subunit